MKFSKSLLFLLFSSVLGMNAGCATLNFQNDFSGQTIRQTPKKEESYQKGYALLLIDANYPEKAFDPERNINGIYNLEEELENMAGVLKQANRRNLPVFEIFIPFQDYAPTTEPELAKYRSENWIPFPKQFGDAFEQTALDQKLKTLGITDLVVMGRNQNACVRWTIEQALELGYRVHISYDLIQDRGNYAYQNRECEITDPSGRKEILPCRSLVQGSNIVEDSNHDYNFITPNHKKLAPGTIVKPADQLQEKEHYLPGVEFEENHWQLTKKLGQEPD